VRQIRNARLHGALKRIDCVNTVLTRPGSDGDDVLLVWNADWRPPAWSFPGGAREPAESLIDAAVREVLEETGLRVDIKSLLDVHERIGLGGRVHLVVFTFAGAVTGGTLIADGRGEPEPGGVSAARWIPVAQARRIPKVSRILDVAPATARGASCTCDHLAKAAAPPEDLRTA